MQKELIEYLSGFVTEKRKELFNAVIKHRTRYITVALEDIFQPHNASAVLRSCDCFGIQDVHIIENRNEYVVNPDVALGASKWLNLIKYKEAENNTITAINALKKKGYRIIATTPHKDDINLETFDIKKGKAAFFFGTELNGLTDLMLENADEYLKIPMYGFTESFNISVSAAITLHYLSHKLRHSEINWQIESNEKYEILLDWYRSTLKNPEILIKEFNKKQKS